MSRSMKLCPASSSWVKLKPRPARYLVRRDSSLGTRKVGSRTWRNVSPRWFVASSCDARAMMRNRTGAGAPHRAATWRAVFPRPSRLFTSAEVQSNVSAGLLSTRTELMRWCRHQGVLLQQNLTNSWFSLEWGVCPSRCESPTISSSTLSPSHGADKLEAMPTAAVDTSMSPGQVRPCRIDPAAEGGRDPVFQFPGNSEADVGSILDDTDRRLRRDDPLELDRDMLDRIDRPLNRLATSARKDDDRLGHRSLRKSILSSRLSSHPGHGCLNMSARGSSGARSSPLMNVEGSPIPGLSGLAVLDARSISVL